MRDRGEGAGIEEGNTRDFAVEGGGVVIIVVIAHARFFATETQRHRGRCTEYFILMFSVRFSVTLWQKNARSPLYLRNLSKQSVDDFVGAHARGFGGEGGEDAVAEDGVGDFLDVFGGDVDAAVEDGAGFSGEDEVDAGAGAGAPLDEIVDKGGGFGFIGAGGADEVAGKGVDVFGDGDAADDFLEFQDGSGVEEAFDVGFVVGGGLFHDAGFFLGRGVADDGHEHEAIELGFGEGVGAFLFDGVLGGEDEEGEGEFVGVFAGGDAVFLHGFEEGGLGFRRGAVDFVGEEHIREDGAFDEAEGAFAGGAVFFEDIGAGDVGGHEVGGELDAFEGEVEDVGDGFDEERFGEAGDADEEDVSLTEHGGEDLFDDFGLSDDDFAELLGHGFVGTVELLDGVKIAGIGGGGRGRRLRRFRLRIDREPGRGVEREAELRGAGAGSLLPRGGWSRHLRQRVRS